MDVVYYTSRGGREVNEDSYFMSDRAFVVCDGLGGHDSGEVASQAAVRTLSELCAGIVQFGPELINTIYLRANQAVISLVQNALTTIVGGFISGDMFYYQSVGDSRLYYFRNGKIYAQTKDDSVCQAAVDMGSMTYDEIRTSEDRSRLLKVLGNDPELKIMRKYEPIRMEKGDAFLVCSDGFWEHVLDEEMEENLQSSKDAEEWLNKMLKIQYERARNADDNYTVICVIVDQLPETAAQPSGSEPEVFMSVDRKEGEPQEEMEAKPGMAIVASEEKKPPQPEDQTDTEGEPLPAPVAEEKGEERSEIHSPPDESLEQMPSSEVGYDPNRTIEYVPRNSAGVSSDLQKPFEVAYEPAKKEENDPWIRPDASDGWQEDEEGSEKKKGFWASLFGRKRK